MQSCKATSPNIYLGERGNRGSSDLALVMPLLPEFVQIIRAAASEIRVLSDLRAEGSARSGGPGTIQ